MIRAWALTLLPVLLLAMSASGCGAKAQASTVPDGPPLVVPSAPPRQIAPPEERAAETPPPAPEAPPPATATAPPRPATRPATPPATPPAAAVTETPPVTPPATATVPTDNRELRATPNTPGAATAATEQSVRARMTQATRDLSRVNYQRLSTDGKANYEQARRFAEQAEQALKERNVVFAWTLADKAAVLAADLIGR
jgi:hypothetical protein